MKHEYNIGDKVVMNCDSINGHYKKGDIGLIVEIDGELFDHILTDYSRYNIKTFMAGLRKSAYNKACRSIVDTCFDFPLTRKLFTNVIPDSFLSAISSSKSGEGAD